MSGAYRNGFLKLTKETKAIFDNAARPLTARELFAGDEELYKVLDGRSAASDNSSQQPPKTPFAVNAKPVTAATAPKRLSIIAIAIRISIGLIAVVLLVPISLYCISAMLAPQHTTSETPVAAHTPAVVVTVTEEPSASAADTPVEAVSWKLAQSYYQKKDYAKASAAYGRLSSNLSLSDPTQAIWGWLSQT